MKDKLIIVGAGGHSKVIIDLIKERDIFEIIGCIDNCVGTEILGVPVIGDDTKLDELIKNGVKYAFVAIGNNKIRKRLIIKLKTLGYKLINVLSEYAKISDYAEIGECVAVMSGAIINAEAVVEDGAIINTGATVDHESLIRKFTHIAPGVNICGRVQVGELSFIGVGASVIDNIKIGKNVVVGAGAAVINDIEEYSKVVGVPARIINTESK